MTRHLPFRLAALLIVLAVAALVPAQTGVGRPAAGPAAQPAKAAPAQPPTAKPSTAAAETPGQAGYSYRSEGRRDPFVSLWSTGAGVRQRAKTEGLAGVYTVDLTIKGILQSEGKFVAIVLGPDAKRQYILHTNDRLADGVVKAITADSVLILQEVSDPLSLARQREVRKTLRAVEEVK
jgi:Tfp pilus assembly protein PilP